jgi:hypothetical protein
MIDRPGIYTDLTAAEYHADPCVQPSLSQSIGKLILDQSPAHARLAHPRLCPPVAAEDEEPEKYVSATAIGNAAHALLLGRGKQVAVGNFDAWRSKEAQKFKAEALAAGRTPILPHHMARAYAMVEAAREQIAAAGIAFNDELGASEVVVAWQENGWWCRTMIDWLHADHRTVLDYKSTAMSCAPHVVEDRPSVMGWDIQAAMHERGLDALDPVSAGRRRHLYINQENEPPYAMTIIQISEADLTMGRKKLAMAMDIWAHCTISGDWPAYPPGIVSSRPRGYLETKWLEREVAHHERREREPMLQDLSGG